MPTASPERLREDLISLVHRGGDVREFSLDAARILRRAVPFDGVCVLTFDPATVLPTGEVIENGLPPEAMPRMTEIEVGETDFNKFPALAQAQVPAGTLSEATGGELDRSARHRDVRGPHGFGDELRAALVAGSATWGGITLLRERGAPDFTPAESRLLAALTPHLAEGLRRSVTHGALAAGEPESTQATGVLLLDDDNTIVGPTRRRKSGSKSCRRRSPESAPAASSRRWPAARAAPRPARTPRTRAPGFGRRRAGGCWSTGPCSVTSRVRAQS